MRYTSGSRPMGDNIAAADAPAVEFAKAGGAILIRNLTGRANLTRTEDEAGAS